MTDINVKNFHKLTKFIDHTTEIYFDELVFGGPAFDDDNQNDPDMYLDFIKKYAKKYSDDESIKKLIDEKHKFSVNFLEDWFYQSLGKSAIYFNGSKTFFESLNYSVDDGIYLTVDDDNIESTISDIKTRHEIYKKLSNLYKKINFNKIDCELDQFLKQNDINKIYQNPDKMSNDDKHSVTAVLHYLTDFADDELKSKFSKSYPEITKFILNMYDPISDVIADAYQQNYDTYYC